MDELLQRALEGIDLEAPGAVWQVYLRLLQLIPWQPLIWLTVISVAGGLAIAWYRGSAYGRALLWALLLGPFGWLISWHAVLPPRICPRCGHEASARTQRCSKCGCTLH